MTGSCSVRHHYGRQTLIGPYLPIQETVEDNAYRFSSSHSFERVFIGKVGSALKDYTPPEPGAAHILHGKSPRTLSDSRITQPPRCKPPPRQSLVSQIHCHSSRLTCSPPPLISHFTVGGGCWALNRVSLQNTYELNSYICCAKILVAVSRRRLIERPWLEREREGKLNSGPLCKRSYFKKQA